ncbi:hypothetical protein GCM10010922_02960 [Microbacterium sorbitolivorans]|uniref:Uncharacterized protein n=1 Tax=Microbacterium sorbitolivorans TaxID=1867410 RepID=A0A367Y971_9MICO|nr:hypothetical protein [Microbacterium sorbitolivorans]RCK61541.1 hypothetical protein DTO57_02585 [Microbacterium sorbitolivorans]GGF31315.1 hypothetical protein GCM10010922_02960 [Microbacterium sorbitolivorans]
MDTKIPPRDEAPLGFPYPDDHVLTALHTLREAMTTAVGAIFIEQLRGKILDFESRHLLAALAELFSQAIEVSLLTDDKVEPQFDKLDDYFAQLK